MRFLLIALILFLMASAVFGFDPGPLPGVKIKNALLYLIVLALMLRVTHGPQLPASVAGRADSLRHDDRVRGA